MRTRNDNTQNSSYGPGGDGAQIAYAIVDSALGRLLVAGTYRGICFAAMGEADATLVAELRSDYPRASIRVFDPNRHEDSRIGLWADALADYIGAINTSERYSQGSTLSENTGRSFAQLMAEKRKQGKL